MWISELSERTGLPVDTIKHYLRVGVLPRGRPLGPQRAEYDESHVARLMLVKALHEVGRLSLDQVKRVFDSVDESRSSLRAAVKDSHQVLSGDLLHQHQQPTAESLSMVDELIARQAWRIGHDSSHREALAVAIDTLCSVRDAGYRESTKLRQLLDLYADHATQVAGEELEHVDTSSRESTLNSVVVGTVLFEPLILITRRLAQEDASRDWWAEEDWTALRKEPSDD